MKKGNKESPKSWFVCKHCKRAFTERIQLLQHKKQNHWSEYFAETGSSLKHENRNGSGNNDVSSDLTLTIPNMEGTDKHSMLQGNSTILVTNSRRISVTEEIRTTVTTQAKSVVAEPQAIVSPGTYTSQIKADGTTPSGISDHCKNFPQIVVKEEQMDTEEPRGQVGILNCPVCDQQFSTLNVWIDHIMEVHGNHLNSIKTELSNSPPDVKKFPATPSASAQQQRARSEAKQCRRPSAMQHSDDKAPTDNWSASFIHRESPAAGTKDNLGPISLKTVFSRLFQCPQCPKHFSNAIRHRNHVNVHLGIRPHHCPFCPMRFFASSTNYKHIKELHTDRLHSTKPITNEAASQKQNVHLTHQRSDDFKSPKHKRSRAPEPDQSEIRIETVFSMADNESCYFRPDEPYTCNICCQVFKRLEVLRTHLRIAHKIHGGREAMKECGAFHLDEPDFEYEAEAVTTSPKRKKRIMSQSPAFISLLTGSANSIASGHQNPQHGNLPTTEAQQAGREGIQREKLTSTQNQNKKQTKRIRNGKATTKCSYCPQYFDTSYIAIHERIHTGEKPFKCTVCSKSFSRQDSVYSHQIIHYDVAKVDEKYICPHSCGYNTDSKRIMCRHIRIRHGVPEVSKDEVVQKSQSSSTTVSFGAESSYSVSPENIEPVSQAKISPETDDTSNRNRQIRTSKVKKAADTLEDRVQPKPKGKSQCPYCKKMFHHSYIEAHIRIHTGEKPFKCRFCPQAFPRPDYLKEHLRRTHGQPMTEEDVKPHESPSGRIDITTATECDLPGSSSHKVSPSSAEADEQEQVPSAQTTMDASPSYRPRQVKIPDKNQTIASSGAKPDLKPKGPIHQCTYCSKMLPTFRRLQEHISTHTGEKLYECSMCEKSFRYGFQFNKHKKTAHEDSADCVTRNPMRLLNHISQFSKAEEYSEQDDEMMVDSTSVTPPMKISSADTTNMPPLSAETRNAIEKMQACMLCDVFTGHLKVHLITTHNMTEEKAEKLAMSA